MKGKKYIVSIDQGTSSTKTLLVDEQGHVLARASEPLHTSYLDNGFVEQDAEAIFQNVLASVKKCLEAAEQNGYRRSAIAACGISNQRETFVIWDQEGKPLHPAIVWQCKRSIGICEELKKQGVQETVNRKTGLLIDPYFSATKLAWLQQNDQAVKKAIENNNAFFGTVDTWLLYRLTGGQYYRTDHTNASRTLLFNLHTLEWDEELIELFGLKGIRLPEIQPSSSLFGETALEGLLVEPLPVTAMIGDSHAAAFGEGCFEPGMAKATLGTGCSVLMNIGQQPVSSHNGMVTTICWSLPGRVDYALEGVIVSCGATIEWLKNELGLLNGSGEIEAMATAVADNGGVYIIPAFSGLGSPHWQMDRRAAITGLSFGSTKNHIARAALESIAYQVKDVIAAMERDAGMELKELMVNGGITANRFVLQFLADLLDRPVVTGSIPDVSALGAAYLAGLYTGHYKNIGELRKLNTGKTTVETNQENERVNDDYKGWKHHIAIK